MCAFFAVHNFTHACNLIAGHPQDYDGKTFYFVDKPAEGVICVVCRALAHNPVQATCCGKIYCAQCIEKWKTRSMSCSTCRSTEESSPPFNVFPDRRAHQDVSTLTVCCPNWRDGCGKKMELAEVDNHLTSDNGCPFQVVDCGNKCGHSAWRSCIPKHMASECPLRRMKCQYCRFISFHDQVTGDHLKECPNYPFDCPRKCGQSLTRSTVLAHQEVCPLQEVECEYKNFGCDVALLRKDITKHLHTSAQDHLQLTKRRLERMEAQLEEERTKRQWIEAQFKAVDAKAERERERVNEAIAHLVDKIEHLELKK